MKRIKAKGGGRWERERFARGPGTGTGRPAPLSGIDRVRKCDSSNTGLGREADQCSDKRSARLATGPYYA